MGKRQKINIPICAALVLLLLTLLTARMTGGLYARYTGTAYASDSARVAKFDVDTKVEQVEDSAGNAVEGQFVLTVTNRSEVAVEYDIAVTVTESVNAAVADATGSSLSADGKTVTFTNENWKLVPLTGTAKHTLQLSLDDWRFITENATGISASKPVEFSVHVTARQVD